MTDQMFQQEITPITAYKGFNTDMQCRGYQYALGKSYVTDQPVKVCHSGFHACLYPIDVFFYYPPNISKYARVKQSGAVVHHDKHDSKVASSAIVVDEMIDLNGLITESIDYTIARCKASDSQTVEPWFNESVYGVNVPRLDPCRIYNFAQGTYGSSCIVGRGVAGEVAGDCSVSAVIGPYSASVAWGYEALSMATGINCVSAVDGISSVSAGAGFATSSKSTGLRSVSATTGSMSASVSNGESGASVCTGGSSASQSFGDFGVSVATNHQSSSTAVGHRSSSCNTGTYSTSTATGLGSASSATSAFSTVYATGEQTIASATGNQSKCFADGVGTIGVTTGITSSSTATGSYSMSGCTGAGGTCTASGLQAASVGTQINQTISVAGQGAVSVSAGPFSRCEILQQSEDGTVVSSDSVAIGVGSDARVRAPAGSAIVCAFRDDSGRLIHIRSSMVGENGIKPNVWYKLDEHGEFQVWGLEQFGPG